LAGVPFSWQLPPLSGGLGGLPFIKRKNKNRPLLRSKSMLRISTIVFCLAMAIQAYALDGNQLLTQIDKNLSPESYESFRKIINVEPDGKKKEYVYFTAKKGRDKMAGLFLSPASEKGRSTLRLGDNMWLYVPNVGKPIRITSLQSVIGGVFNNADILALDYAEEYNVEKLDSSPNEILLYLKAKTKNVAYDRIKMWVDKNKNLPTKLECQTDSNMLIKTLYFKDSKDFGAGLVRPAVIETDSPLFKGYKSVMIFAKIKKKDFKDEVFTLTFMSKIDSLR
jgi:outer membrane lipoprotein-sorting protein